MTRMLVEILTATFEIQRNHNDLSYQERMKPVKEGRQGGTCNINRISYRIFHWKRLFQILSTRNFFSSFIKIILDFIGIMNWSTFQQKLCNHELDIFLQLC